MYNYKIFILESDALLIPSLIGFFGLHALLFVICKIIKKKAPISQTLHGIPSRGY
jgi:hypothetical protein